MSFSKYELADQSPDPKWYLIRTKQHKEPLVHNVLRRLITDDLLPLLRTIRVQQGRITKSVVPLFPGYLFACFDLKAQYQAIQRTPGVVGVVCAGDEPTEVDEVTIAEIRKRAINGIVDLPPRSLHSGESVNVNSGPFRGIDAVFERYLSGSERVALLVELVGGANVRVILPSALVGPTRDTVNSGLGCVGQRRASG